MKSYDVIDSYLIRVLFVFTVNGQSMGKSK